MLFYLAVVLVFGLIIHSSMVAYQKRETIFPDGSKVHQLEFMNDKMERKINRGYHMVTTSVLFVVFGLMSAFVGSMIGMFIYLSI
jgi:hypothetical protein